MEHNSLTYFGKVILSVAWDFLYFPIWWYSAGLFDLVKRLGRFVRQQEESLAFSIWLKNIFVPMYGQSDFAGRVISFVIRLVQVIYRGSALLIIILISLILMILYLVLPVLIWLAIYQQMS